MRARLERRDQALVRRRRRVGRGRERVRWERRARVTCRARVLRGCGRVGAHALSHGGDGGLPDRLHGVDASRVQRGRDVGHRGHERVWYELVLCVSVSANHVSGRGRVARHQRGSDGVQVLRRRSLRLHPPRVQPGGRMGRGGHGLLLYGSGCGVTRRRRVVPRHRGLARHGRRNERDAPLLRGLHGHAVALLQHGRRVAPGRRFAVPWGLCVGGEA